MRMGVRESGRRGGSSFSKAPLHVHVSSRFISDIAKLKNCMFIWHRCLNSIVICRHDISLYICFYDCVFLSQLRNPGLRGWLAPLFGLDRSTSPLPHPPPQRCLALRTIRFVPARAILSCYSQKLISL